MARGGSRTLIDLDSNRLTVLALSVAGERVAVERALILERPEDVDPSDARAMGGWIDRVLETAKVGRRGVVLSLSRRDAVLKRLSLPVGEGVSEAELASMVRLAMGRQLAVSLDGGAVDYVPLEGGRGGEREVLAGALPAERLGFCREMAEAARLKLSRITLRSFGVQELVRSSAQGAGEDVLVISPGAGSTEVVVVSSGRLVFARSAEVAAPREGHWRQSADRIAVEAKRTWMSYRVAQPAPEIGSILVVGEDEPARLVAARCGEVLELSSGVLGRPKWIELASGVDAPVGLVLPLAALARAEGAQTLDFAVARKVSDPRAASRRVALLAALLLLVVGGMGWLIGEQKLGAIERDLRTARERNGELRGQYAALLGEQARLEHLRAWVEHDVDWIGHLRWISDQLPDPSEGLVNEIRGSLRAERVRFTPGVGGPLAGEWEVPWEASFTFDGAASEPAMVNELRERLLSGRGYRVRTEGPDRGETFKLRLLTSESRPPAAPEREMAGP